MTDKHERLMRVKRHMIMINLVNLLPNLALGLAFYGLFVADGNAFFPWLNDKTHCYILIAISLLIEMIAISAFLGLLREKKLLMQQE